MPNQKLTRIREKKGKTAVSRRQIAAKHAAKRKKLNAVEQPVPAFLRIEADECDRHQATKGMTPAYRVPDVFRQPDVVPEASGILYAKGYKHRDFVPRDSSRVGILMILLSACAVAAVALKATGVA